jgi:hypothetical protein
LQFQIGDTVVHPIHGVGTVKYQDGESVVIQSTSTDASGIARVDLLVDGAVVRTDTTPGPQLSFTLLQTWTATPGTHTVAVRAFNTANVESNPAAIALTVLGTVPVAAPLNATEQARPPTSAAQVPPAAIAAEPPKATAAAAVCTDNSAFVEDVTVAHCGLPISCAKPKTSTTRGDTSASKC